MTFKQKTIKIPARAIVIRAFVTRANVIRVFVTRANVIRVFVTRAFVIQANVTRSIVNRPNVIRINEWEPIEHTVNVETDGSQPIKTSEYHIKLRKCN
jgi:hypothetical protein